MPKWREISIKKGERSISYPPYVDKGSRQKEKRHDGKWKEAAEYPAEGRSNTAVGAKTAKLYPMRELDEIGNSESVRGIDPFTCIMPDANFAKRPFGAASIDSLLDEHLNITEGPGRRRAAQVPPFRYVCTPSNTFAGRNDLLQRVHKILQDCTRRENVMNRIVALVGPGGIGKSETAKQLVHGYKKYYENVAWIDAGSENSMKVSFRKLCKHFNLPHSSDDEGLKLARTVYSYYGANYKKPALFIFDHANGLKFQDGTFGIYDYLPTKETRRLPLILLTSESNEWGSYGCKLIPVPHLNAHESKQILLATFDMKEEQLEQDKELQGSLENLTDGLEGHPLALELAAASIPYLLGEQALPWHVILTKERLKESIRSCLWLMNDTKMSHEQRVTDVVAMDYPGAFRFSWDVAMRSFQFRVNGEEARRLLLIIAWCGQEHLQDKLVSEIYGRTCEVLGVTFPTDDDSSFVEAIDELEVAGLVKLANCFGSKTIHVNSRIQTMAKLEDKSFEGIQKIMLNFLFSPAKMAEFEELLWSPDDGIPDWVLKNEQAALMWLCGFRLLAGKVNPSRMSNVNALHTKLIGLPGGADLGAVARFLASSYSNLRKLDDSHANVPWHIFEHAIQLKSSLATDLRDVRIILELLILHPVADYIKEIIDFLKLQKQSPSWACPPRNIVNSLAEWLCDFDYGKVAKMKLPSRFFSRCFHDLFRNLAKLSSYKPLFRDGFKLVRPQALCSLANAEVQLIGRSAMDVSALTCQLLSDLGHACSISQDGIKDLIQNYNFLDHVSTALSSSAPDLGIRMLHEIMVGQDCTQDVLEHEELMKILTSSHLWRFKDPSLSTADSFIEVKMPSEDLQNVFPGNHESGFLFQGRFIAQIFRTYRLLVLFFAAARHKFLQGLPVLKTLTEWLTKEKWVLALKCMPAKGYCDIATVYSTTDVKQFLEQKSSELPICLETDLKKDWIILNFVLKQLNGKKAFPKESINEVVVVVTQRLQKFNEMLYGLFTHSAKQQEPGGVPTWEKTSSPESLEIDGFPDCKRVPCTSSDFSAHEHHTISSDGNFIKPFWTAADTIGKFVGRKEILDDIHRKFQESSNSGQQFGHIVALLGMAGVGKTQLARKFSQKYKEFYSNVAWINAENEESIREGFVSLAETLGLSVNGNEDGKHVAKRVFQHLGQYESRMLFIFDDAEVAGKTNDDESSVLTYLPAQGSASVPRILIISDWTDWNVTEISAVLIKNFTQDESMEFLRAAIKLTPKEHAGRFRDLNDALFSVIQGYPLGLQLVAAVLNHKVMLELSTPVLDHLEALVSSLQRKTELKRLEEAIENRVQSSPIAFQVLWTTIMETIQNDPRSEGVKSILQILAYLCPGDTSMDYLKFIYMATLTGGPEIHGNMEYDSLMQLLKALAIIEVYADRRGTLRVTIHTEIQKRLRLDDPAGKGLQKILSAEKLELVQRYMGSQDELSIPAAILNDDGLTISWLKCLVGVLVGKNNFSRHGTFFFDEIQAETLRRRGSKSIDGIIANIKLVRRLISVHADERIQAIKSIEAALKPVTSFRMVQPPVQNFQGRQDLMQGILNKLKERTELGHWLGRTLALVGFSGMGKSELARKFVDAYQEEYPNVAWIDASTEETICKSFYTLADMLYLPWKNNEGGKEIAQRVFQHIGQHVKSSMLVYDNAQTLKGFAGRFGIFDYLPQKYQKNMPLILITSQTAEWRREGIPLIWVNELKEEDSQEYLRSELGIRWEEIQADEQLKKQAFMLLKTIQGYPLGLQLATNMLLNNMQDKHSLRESLVEVVTKLDGLDDELMNFQINLMERPWSFNGAWKAVTANMQEEEFGAGASMVLQMLAYCKNDAPIEVLRGMYQCLDKGGMKTHQSCSFDQAIHGLKKFGLARARTNAEGVRCLDIHTLVKKFAVRADKDGVALKCILMAEQFQLLDCYLMSPAEACSKLPTLLKFLPSLLPENPMMTFSIIRRAMDYSMFGPTVVDMKGLREMIKEYLQRIEMDNPRSVPSDSTVLYMGHVICFGLILREYGINKWGDEIYRQKLQRWLPDRKFANISRIRIHKDIDALREEMDGYGWSLDADQTILNDMEDTMSRNNGLGRDTDTVFKLIEQLRSCNASLVVTKAGAEGGVRGTMDDGVGSYPKAPKIRRTE